MTTLVVASSKHGSTREIGERIAAVLHANKGVTTVVAGATIERVVTHATASLPLRPALIAMGLPNSVLATSSGFSTASRSTTGRGLFVA